MADDEGQPFTLAAFKVYLCLLRRGMRCGWGRVPSVGKVAALAGVSRNTASRSMSELEDRGYLPGRRLIAKDRVVRTAKDVQRMTPIAAERAGYIAVTDLYTPAESHLLTDFIRQNEGAPIVIVEFPEGCEVWRHSTAVARCSQAEQVNLGTRLRMGSVGGDL